MLGEPVSHHGEGGRAVCETAGVRLCCQGDGYLAGRVSRDADLSNKIAPRSRDPSPLNGVVCQGDGTSVS